MKRPEGFDQNAQSQEPPPVRHWTRPSKAERERGRPHALPKRLQRAPTAAKEPAAAALDRPATPRVTKQVRTATRQRRRYEKNEIKRFTRRSRSRRLGWLVAIGIALGLAGLLAVAVYSPLLALRTITIDGTSQVSAAEVHAAIDGQLGTPLALLDYDALTSELGAFTLIQSFVTEVVPPSTLKVHILERAPVGSLPSASGFLVVDPAGVVLRSSPDRVSGAPLIDIGSSDTDSVAFRAVVEVLLALPDSVRTQVDKASASSQDDVTLVLIGVGQRVVWGSAERSALKARVLQNLIAAQSASAHVEYDVSAPLSPVVRPG